MSGTAALTLFPTTSNVPMNVLLLLERGRTMNSQPILSAAAVCAACRQVPLAPLILAVMSRMRLPLSPEPSRRDGAAGVPNTVRFPASVL